MNKKSISAFFFAWLDKLILFYVDKYEKERQIYIIYIYLIEIIEIYKFILFII